MSAAEDVTAAVVRTALACRLEDLPASAVHVAKRSILDVLACAVAGSEDESARLAAAFAHENGGGSGSVIVGTALLAPAPLAALANGTAAHALDFDDVSMRMIHPSATLVPALLAIAESRQMSGRALLEGYVAGFEVEARLCRELNPEHYERGWHTTGSVGPLGAALAACRALRLDAERSRHALGIAASSSSGIRRNFGSMVKPLHAGQAAFHGLQAALLAERGFTANTDVLDGANGFLDVFSELERGAGVAAAFAAGTAYELVESGIALKRFACCGAIHSAQDAVLELLAEPGVRPDDVVRVECRVNRLVPGILVHHVTQDGLEGKFSMEYSLAVCLADRCAGLAQYTDKRAADPALVPLMERVSVTVDESLPVNLAYFPSVVIFELADGRRRASRVDVPKGYPEKPLSDHEVESKVRDCCAPVLNDGCVDELVTTALSLEEVDDAASLARLLAAGEGGWVSGN
jgi:2-methylcitrate dehydratase PrpD